MLLTACSVTLGSPDTTTVPTTPVGNLDRYYNQQIKWTGCEGGFLCTWFEVPLDYANPDGQALRLRVLKSPTRDKQSRVGSLVLNPGGPGGSGYQYALYSSASFSSEITQAFDIVGFDPRGVGKSDPIACLSDKQTDSVMTTLGAPASREDVPTVAEAAALVGQTCKENSPSLVPQIGTVPAARDMDILRNLLDEPKLNFLGLSYGTFLGLTYADLFTDKVGRFVLDGLIDPALTHNELAHGQADGFQRALGRFVDHCNKQPGCPLPKGRDAGIARITTWLAGLAVTPIKGRPGRPLTRPLAANGVLASLYDHDAGWPTLATALRAGFAGNGAPMVDIVDSFTGRAADGQYPDNSLDALYAVNCLDRPDRNTPDETWELGNEWNKTAPTFGAELAWSNQPCFDWPAPPTDGPHPIAAQGAPPILLVGTLNDPATPYEWAQAVDAQLANSVLLTADIDGHTAFNRNSCVTRAIDNALVKQQLPPTGTTCSVE